MGEKRSGKNICCKACKKEFYVPAYRINTAKFCSLNCQNVLQYEKFKFCCKQCNKSCETSPCRKGKRVFCSILCKSQFEIDVKSCQREKRKEYIREARKKGIVGKTGYAVRKFAFSQKEKECMICGYMEHECCLDIHHADKNPNNNELENLIILCVMCHRKIHRNIISLSEAKKGKKK